MQPVPTGLPAGLTGLPAGFTGLPVGLTGLKLKSSRATGLPAGLTGLIGGPLWAGPFFSFSFLI